ncbi:MAG: zinc metallopeptidase, partial [Planctomycetes bacterium]|nr:zinc metallopeptidase [Planctomycetota bacterium]
MIGWFDPMYFVFVGPAMLLAAWAQWRVKSAYARGSKYTAHSGLTGAQTAQRILHAYGITDVTVEGVKSFLGDHYDPKHKTLRLSPDVYNGRSLASLGIAAHEVGHAIQHAHGYAPLAIRSSLVPAASVGTHVSMGLIFLGVILSSWMHSPIGGVVAVAGLGLFSLGVLFQLVNLPVEFNASSRARAILLNQGMVTAEEDKVVAKVLN